MTAPEPKRDGLSQGQAWRHQDRQHAGQRAGLRASVQPLPADATSAATATGPPGRWRLVTCWSGGNRRASLPRNWWRGVFAGDACRASARRQGGVPGPMRWGRAAGGPGRARGGPLRSEQCRLFPGRAAWCVRLPGPGAGGAGRAAGRRGGGGDVGGGEQRRGRRRAACGGVAAAVAGPPFQRYRQPPPGRVQQPHADFPGRVGGAAQRSSAPSPGASHLTDTVPVW
jgi:hypothetical protein